MRVEHIGSATLYLGDCMDVLPSLSGVDVVVTDPPYGLTNNDWDQPVDLVRWWNLLWGTGYSIALICAGQPFTSALVSSNLSNYKHEWIWRKNRGSNFANTVREPFKEHESILAFAAGAWTYNGQREARRGGGQERAAYKVGWNPGGTNYRSFAAREPVDLAQDRVPSSVQDWTTEVGEHPTQKPVAMMEYLVRTYTNGGDNVLDCFMGSGTVGVACASLGRRFVGIEREAKYFDVACRRIEQASRQGDLFVVAADGAVA